MTTHAKGAAELFRISFRSKSWLWRAVFYGWEGRGQEGVGPQKVQSVFQNLYFGRFLLRLSSISDHAVCRSDATNNQSLPRDTIPSADFLFFIAKNGNFCQKTVLEDRFCNLGLFHQFNFINKFCDTHKND